MKRYGNLWPEIISFDNLWLAAKKAQKGKRFRDNVLEFNYRLEPELYQLQAELRSKSYCPGAYRTFRIVDPKPRLISAAPYRDRVVHHALCNVIVPLIEKSFIDHTYANRKGYGTHRALKRFIQFVRTKRYILQCDVQKYFPSIDHEILKTLIRHKIKCPDTLWLIDTIIDSSHVENSVQDYFPGDDLLAPLLRPKGLPIGNLTSQFFGNYYLSGLDRFIKEELKISSYLRYVDDFAAFSDDYGFLKHSRAEIEEHLLLLRLKIHPVKSQLFETKVGANFVGFRVFPDHIRIRSDNLRRARRRLKKYQQAYSKKELSLEEII